MGTAAMLNLCERDAICTGYKPDAEPNYKLLRVVPAGSAAKNVAHQFVLERL